MAINKKLILFKKLSDFNSELSAGNILDSSIVFIKDTKQIYTQGQIFPCPYTQEELTALFNNKVDLSKLDEYLTKTSAASLYQPKGNYITSIPVANGTTAGIIKQGGDVTISDGIISIVDDSHNHVISNIDGLQTILDAKVPTSRTINGKALSSNIILGAGDVGADASGSASSALSSAKSYTDTEIAKLENTKGTYSKPSGGIPKTDLTTSVQESLGKADTALQTELDPIFKASAAYNITSSDITNWNSKTSNTGTVTGIKMNGTTKSPSSGIVDLGTIITSIPVTSVAGKTGAVTLAKGDVGLSNVDNTSDVNKPISTATQTALNAKAPLASPAFTGTPTAPTASNGTNTTQIATTAFVQSAIDTKLAANDAMIFKGTIGATSGNGYTVTSLPSTHNAGWTYKVAEAGTYAGVKCEIGDMIICITDGTSANDAHWTVIQTNIDGAVTGPSSSTDAHVAVFNGTTGKVIKDSGFTIGKSVPSDALFTDTTYTAGTGLNLSNKAFSVKYGTSEGTACQGNDSRLSNSRPASDVYSWAKQSTKPSYTYSEVGAAPASHTQSYTTLTGSGTTPNQVIISTGETDKWTLKTLGTNAFTSTTIPTNTNQLTNGAGFITSSASISGNAATATALTSSAGSETQPIYFSGGKPVECKYSLGKSVPSDALFTDTWRGITDSVTTTDSTISSSATAVKTAYDKAVSAYNLANSKTSNTGTITGVTAGNGLTGGGTSGSVTLNIGAGTGISVTADAVSLATVTDLTAGNYGPSTNASPAHSGTFSVPYITVDAYGRVTAAATRTITLPSSGNTNYYPTKFTWTAGTTSGPTGSLSGSGMSAVSFAAIPSATDSASGIVTTGSQTFAGDKTFRGNIILNASSQHNNDQFIKFAYSSTDLDSYSWRIGYLGTGSGNTNYFTIQSNGYGDKTAWTSAVYFGLEDLSATFAGAVAAPSFVGNGSGLTNLNGSNITSGTIAKAILCAHSHAYTPAGSVSSSFTGTAHDHAFTGGKHKHTFTGSAVTSGGPSKTTSVYSITGVGSLPSCTFPTVVPTKVTLPTVVMPKVTMPSCTLPSVSVSYSTSTGELSVTHNAGSYSAGSYTAGSVTAGSVTAGSVTAGSFSAGSLPTRSEVTLASSDHTHSVTAAGALDEVQVSGTIGSRTAGGSVSSSFSGTASTATTIS